MQSNGLCELQNPSEYFLAERAEDAFGNAICAVREGVRNFLMEVQVLTVKTNFGNPRRTASGISISKFHLLLAVISKFTPFKSDNVDAYCNVVGGFRVQDPAADLAICAAIISSRAEKEIFADTIIFGEVGLSGEVRRVPNIDTRLAEIKKLGFKKVICPRIPKGQKIPKNIKIIEIKNIVELAKSILGK
jgi:DNA repair protein RadA/Sms